jgi:hypothetical protein
MAMVPVKKPVTNIAALFINRLTFSMNRIAIPNYDLKE